MADLLSTSLAYKTLKSDKAKVETAAPKNIKESIFAKPLTWAVIAGAALYFGSKLLKKSPTAEARKDERELESEGEKATYMDQQYKGYADSIYSARIANNLFGTDEDVIYSVFKKMKNNLDVAKLITAFGTRRLSYSFTSANLGGFLNDELDENEMNIINTDLKSKGIKYQF
jgi:hypothetical protein